MSREQSTEDTDHDVLDGADVGETRHVRQTDEFPIYRPDEFSGSDRQTDAEPVDLELIQTEYGGYDLCVTWEGDVTKRLPRNWDQCREPRTDAERKRARRAVWKRRVGAVLPIAFALGLSTLIAARIMNEVAGSATINGEPLFAPTVADLAVPVGLIVVIAYILIWAMSGGMPRMWGRA